MGNRERKIWHLAVCSLMHCLYTLYTTPCSQDICALKCSLSLSPIKQACLMLFAFTQLLLNILWYHGWTQAFFKRQNLWTIKNILRLKECFLSRSRNSKIYKVTISLCLDKTNPIYELFAFESNLNQYNLLSLDFAYY
jgi:hypothetical protein